MEALFVFQLISKHGFIGDAFDRVAEDIQAIPLILEQEEYDATRLTAPALQQLALKLLKDEQKREAELAAEKGANGLSPTSKKRKLPAPPLPTLEDAHAHPEKLNHLIDRLYAQFRRQFIAEIKEEERRFEQLEREMDDIKNNVVDEELIREQRGIFDERQRQEKLLRDNEKENSAVGLDKTNGHGPPAAVPAAASSTAVPVPAPVPVQPKQKDATKRTEPITTPSPTPQPPPEKRPLQPSPSPLAAAPIRPSSEQRQITPDSRTQQEIGRTPNEVAPGLQHPQMNQGYPPRPSSATPQVPMSEASSKGRSPTPGQPSQGGLQNPAQAPALKWEPPYQHPSQPPLHQTPPSAYPLPNQTASPAQSHPTQSYNNNVKQGQGQGPAARVPTPVTGAPSPPVLLAPQNSGQVPPSLPSLPQSSSRGPPVPAVPPPGPSIPPKAYVQSTSTPVQTPVHPQSGLAATHPMAAAATKPLVQIGQRPQQASLGQSPQQQPHPPPHAGTRPQLQPLPEAQQLHRSASQRPIAHTPVSTPQPPRLPPSASIQTPGGHGTKWTSTPTPATPRMEIIGGGYFDIKGPDFEPLSPTLQPNPQGKKESVKPVGKTETAQARGRSSRGAPKVETTPISDAPNDSDQLIKNEVATPQGFEDQPDIGSDGTAAEQILTSANGASNKRKRQDSPLNREPATPATHVLWTRAFHKISMAALDQIIGHRYANMFANPIKPRLAPGYYDIILRPQDLKGIQKAIATGSKAASAAVADMPDVAPNQFKVWLPISIDLLPPRGIINIEQLERELIHMFANAIMYNPDPQRGLGPSFFRNYQSNPEGNEDDARGYEFDENGVVKETRNMFSEVEKLVSDLRSELKKKDEELERATSAAVGEGDDQAGDAKRRRRG
ncbi:hypothetical protein F5Y16DRAFT_408478 [Xylariaceae sp. FL0255]|nr:hypothetical protein F5Y16DRAFT_408478 [Xylariaceae sp. FL0255]